MIGRKPMKLAIKDHWTDENTGDKYAEVRIDKYTACCVKKIPDGHMAMFECDDGNDVYSDIGGADFPLRKLTDLERSEIFSFTEKHLCAESGTLNEKDISITVKPCRKKRAGRKV